MQRVGDQGDGGFPQYAGGLTGGVGRKAGRGRWVLGAVETTTMSGRLRQLWLTLLLTLCIFAVLVTGIVYLNQWRAGLIDARIQSLRDRISAAEAGAAAE